MGQLDASKDMLPDNIELGQQQNHRGIIMDQTKQQLQYSYGGLEEEIINEKIEVELPGELLELYKTAQINMMEGFNALNDMVGLRDKQVVRVFFGTILTRFIGLQQKLAGGFPKNADMNLNTYEMRQRADQIQENLVSLHQMIDQMRSQK